MINEHLLECEKVKIKNYNHIIEIKSFITKNEIQYKIEDFFTDYGLT